MKVRTMRGVTLDMAQIMAQHETTVAIGNASMNARGDIVGPGGQIVKSKEQVVQEYYKGNPNSVKSVSLKEVQPDVFMTPGEVMEEIEKISLTAAKGKKIVDNDE